MDELVSQFETSVENLSTQDSYDGFLNDKPAYADDRNRARQQERENGNGTRKSNNNEDDEDDDDDDDSDTTDSQDATMMSHGMINHD